MRRAYLYAMSACLLWGCHPYMPTTENQGQEETTINTEIDAIEDKIKKTAKELIISTIDKIYLLNMKNVTESDTEDEKLEAAGRDILKEDNKIPERTPVKVKGIYLSAYTAGSGEQMDKILSNMDGTEINAVVIDVKDDEGRITFTMDNPLLTEIGAQKRYISDIGQMMEELKARDLYVIARVVAFRDPFLAEKKPEWSLKTATGEIYRDKSGLAWVNPYRQEVWDYLVEIGRSAGEYGFDEIQFDYIRFATDKTMNQVVFDQKDVKGRSKTDIITEFTEYAGEKLEKEGLFVSADVFGAIIGSQEDSDAVGQIYQEMAKRLDYICPMIYPSHYGEGNFGIPYPDLQPYDTILAALKGSRSVLEGETEAGIQTQTEAGVRAIVRPWLQDFTASYLQHHIPYGPKEIRAQIQAVYDSGYEEWILWNASNRYTWDGLLKEER